MCPEVVRAPSPERPDAGASAVRTPDLPLLAFLFLTFGTAWLMWLLSGVLDRPTPRQTYDSRWLVAQLGVFAPALAALVVSAVSGRRLLRSSILVLLAVFVPATLLGIWVARTGAHSIPGIGRPLSLLVVVVGGAVLAFFSPLNRQVVNPGSDAVVGPVRSGWILGAALYPIAAFLIAWLLVGGWTNGPFAAALSGGSDAAVWTALTLWCFNLLFGGSLGEEVGWRGYALPRLLERHGPIAASSILALAWALWHAPIDLTYGFGLQGPGALVLRLLWTWPGTIIFTFFFLRARGSLLAPLALHASFNVLTDLGTAALAPATQMLFVVNLIVAMPLAFRMERQTGRPLDALGARATG
jgi:uncharacterized protein